MRNREFIGRMVTESDRKTLQRAIEKAKSLSSCLGSSGIPVLRTHEGADPDGIGAIKFLQDYLRTRFNLASNIYLGPVLFTSRPFADRLDISDTVDSPQTDGMLFVLDTCARPLLNSNGFTPDKTTVIDHHIPDITSIDATYMIRNPRAVSTCEMLASLVPASYISDEGAFALAVGIASDTERLRVAERTTIAIFERLLRIAQVKRSDIDELADPQWDHGRILAIGKDMRTVKWGSYEKSGKTWVYGIGKSSLEMPFVLANALRRLEADVSVAISDLSGGRFKISVRVGFSEANRSGVHANDIARIISLKLGMPQQMWGGGEIDRAGAILVSRIDKVIATVDTAIREVIDAAARKVAF